MLRFLAHLMRMSIPRPQRYLETHLTSSCDLSPSQVPGVSTPQATSCDHPPIHGLQDQGYRMVPPSPPPSLHLSALEETKLTTQYPTTHIMSHSKSGHQ